MATTERASGSANRNRVAWIFLGVLAAGAIVLAIVALNRPPQMGTDEDVFHTVDALFTAVTARDEKRLGECEQRLHAYRVSGKLPAGPADYLDRVIAKARGGGWESAAERLYEFMLSQRREGELEEHPQAPKPLGPTRPGKK